MLCIHEALLRSVAALLAATGAAFFISGTGGALLALECNQGPWIQPAECIAAHVEPAAGDHVTGNSSGCASTNGVCGASGEGCSATPKFNGARNGVCQAYIGGSDVYRCAENYTKTAITLSKVIGGCAMEDGKCGCKYSAAMPAETHNVEVCDCKQEKT
jgi:hypothetical protein